MSSLILPGGLSCTFKIEMARDAGLRIEEEAGGTNSNTHS